MKSQIVRCMQAWPKPLRALLLVGLVQPWAACADTTPGALPKDPSGTVVGAPKKPSTPNMTAAADPLRSLPAPAAQTAGVSATEQAAGARAEEQVAGSPAAGGGAGRAGGAGRTGGAGSAAGRRADDDEEEDD